MRRHAASPGLSRAATLLLAATVIAPTRANSIAALASLGENEDTSDSGQNVKPFCVATNPSSGRALHQFLLVSDYSGVSYFDVDPWQSEPITDVGRKTPLIVGSQFVPGGYADAVAACCNQLYVAVNPPASEGTNSAEGGRKGCASSTPRVLQFGYVVEETTAASGSRRPTARLSVLDQNPKTVFAGRRILDLSCSSSSGDLFVAFEENAADGTIHQYSGADLSKLSLQELSTVEPLKPFERKPVRGMPRAVSTDDMNLFYAQDESGGKTEIQKLLVKDAAHQRSLIHTVQKQAVSAVCSDAKHILYVAEHCAAGSEDTVSGVFAPAGGSSSSSPSSSCHDALFQLPKFPVAKAALLPGSPGFLAAANRPRHSTAAGAPRSEEEEAVEEPKREVPAKLLIENLKGARACATDGESTVFVLHQSEGGDYKVSQVIPGGDTSGDAPGFLVAGAGTGAAGAGAPATTGAVQVEDPAAAATTQVFLETAPKSTIEILEEPKRVALLIAPAV